MKIFESKLTYLSVNKSSQMLKTNLLSYPREVGYNDMDNLKTFRLNLCQNPTIRVMTQRNFGLCRRGNGYQASHLATIGGVMKNPS
jgi:hypothetical protein